MDFVEKLYTDLVREISGNRRRRHRHHLIISEDAAYYLTATIEFLIVKILNGSFKISSSGKRQKKILPSDINQYLINDDELRALIFRNIINKIE